MTEIQKSTVIELETAGQRLSDTREDQPMSRALVPLGSRSVREQWQTALRLQSVREALAVEPDNTHGNTIDSVKQAYDSFQAQPTDAQLAIRTTREVSIPPGRQVSLYDPQSDKLALERKASLVLTGNTLPVRFIPPDGPALKNATPLETDGAQAREQRMSRAESIVLNAIRSKADIDGKHAKVDYDGLAAMTGFSRRHVMRAVKSLIFERQRLRVDKRVIKPGHNAINVYHVVTPQRREVTSAERGASLRTGKIGTKREIPDRLFTKGDRTGHPNSQNKNTPLLPPAEKTGSTYLTAGRKLL